MEREKLLEIEQAYLKLEKTPDEYILVPKEWLKFLIEEIKDLEDFYESSRRTIERLKAKIKGYWIQ